MKFDKYEQAGAYHWRETDRMSADFNPPLVARYDILLAAVEGGLTLDAGAGDGYLSARLADRCEEVVALEYEAGGATLAAKMLSGVDNVSVIRGDSCHLPFADSSLSVVVMADVIEHIEDDAAAVAEVSRVLSPSGSFVLTTPKWRADRVWDTHHVREYRAEDLEALLRTGFEQVELTYFWPLAWSDRYSTRIGWRLLKFAGRMGFNPFTRQSAEPAGFGQILAVARKPLP